MPDVSLTRRYRFSASHRLDSPLLSADENREVYGKCNNPYGHGHDYVMEVTLRGEVDPKLGRYFSVEALDLFVKTVVLNHFDRRNLNTEIPEFTALVPTTENLANVIARRLSGAWHIAQPAGPARFEKLRIWETRNNIFEVFAAQPIQQKTESNEVLQSCSEGI